MKTNGNDPIDWSQFIPSQTSFDGTVCEGTKFGLTKREYFAAMAMQGLCSTGKYNSSLTPSISVHISDALIAELNKEAP